MARSEARATWITWNASAAGIAWWISPTWHAPQASLGRAATDRPHWLGGAPFVIPDLKTSDVEVDRWCLAPPRPFHDQVLFRQDDVAGATGLPGARTAPDHREPVMR